MHNYYSTIVANSTAIVCVDMIIKFRLIEIYINYVLIKISPMIIEVVK